MIDDRLLQQIEARLSAALAAPDGRYLPLRVHDRPVGWLDHDRATRLLRFDHVFEATDGGVAFVQSLDRAAARTSALAAVARALAAEGRLSAWRDESYEVAFGPGETPLFELERAAARYFGIVTRAAHVTGVVGVDGGMRMWIARRSARKAIDPGQLDNLVGGGIRARTTVDETVRREAWEEAGIAATVARTARGAGAVRICRAQPDGLQREVIYVHDLLLPADFAPESVDHEVVEHRLVTLTQAAHLIAQGDGAEVVTADASLVIVDFLLRHGALAPDSPYYLPLAGLRWPRLEPGAGVAENR